MRLGRCICCDRIKELVTWKVCGDCVKKIKKSFMYTVDGKQVTKQTYDRIMKRGYIIPEEIEEIRNEQR